MMQGLTHRKGNEENKKNDDLAKQHSKLISTAKTAYWFLILLCFVRIVRKKGLRWKQTIDAITERKGKERKGNGVAK